jgi:1,3-beta-galactosyl-N-acetylhexosamine phosphorylase
VNVYQPSAPVPTTGRFTLPAEAGQDELVKQLAQKWGADNIRDSDGTELSETLLALGLDVFSTICLVRAEQSWPQQHPEHLPRKFLRSDSVTAASGIVEIQPLRGFFDQKYRLDTHNDPKRWWEVHDRTTGKVVKPERWDFDAASGTVTIRKAKRFHLYTVNFLVAQIWDSTSMYNHLTNNWTCAPIVSVDPFHPECYAHLMDYFDRWLAAHPRTNVVRLTTLAYHFTIDTGADGKTRYFDGCAYTDTVSIPALEAFEKEHGYRLTSEDFVDAGLYHATCRVPTPRSRAWMQFIHRFVVRFGRDLTDRIHRAGKKAAMFWGDHWVGTEPYLPGFQEMGIDIHINACEGGVVLRRCAEAPGPQTKEVRFYPYFFPDTFRPGGDPLGESQLYWAKVRRALLRTPVDRIGYGGYLSLAGKFPEFIAHVGELAQEFRTILEVTQRTKSYRHPVRVAVLSAWGAQRAWWPYEGRDQKFNVSTSKDIFLLSRCYLLECLAGLPFDVQFLGLEDVAAQGIPKDVDVLLNDGDAGSAWSGGAHWKNPKIVSAVRRFVHRGGGFLGFREPTAQPFQGRVFQLADVLGVDLELGQSVSQRPVAEWSANPQHFLLADASLKPDFGTDRSYVYPVLPDTQVLATAPGGHVLAAARDCSQGRAAFFAGLPFTLDNCGLLHRAILWAARQEYCLTRWHSSNARIECAWYPEVQRLIVVNNAGTPQSTTVFDGQGRGFEVELGAFGSRWFEVEGQN